MTIKLIILKCPPLFKEILLALFHRLQKAQKNILYKGMCSGESKFILIHNMYKFLNIYIHTYVCNTNTYIQIL